MAPRPCPAQEAVMATLMADLSVWVWLGIAAGLAVVAVRP
jgi:hypothetical protein